MTHAEERCWAMPLALRPIQDFVALSAIEEQALIGNWNERDILAMLYGYFDESGEHGPDGKLVQLTLGGFIARWPQVQRLCERWREALDDFAWAEFHMKKFASDEHNYARWSPARQGELDRFVSILCKEVENYCAYSYKVTKTSESFKDTYETALSRIMLSAESEAVRQNDRIRLVFAQTQEISGAGGMIGGYFDRLTWDHLSGYEIGKSSESPPLQAAEIVVRGLAREVRDDLVTHSFRRVRAAAKTFDYVVHR